MKFVIASDIHGSATWCKKFLEAAEVEQAERILLLGDVLYHGPRNDLPEGYAPKEVIAMLNPLAERIICVRGNCEAEVDQMVLNFPCMADSTVVFDPAAIHTPDGDALAVPEARELFLTHGHVFGAGFHNSVDNLPQLPAGSILLYGHTHKKVNEPATTNPDIWAFNPGSVSIPKDGTHSFGIYEDGALKHVILS